MLELILLGLAAMAPAAGVLAAMPANPERSMDDPFTDYLVEQHIQNSRSPFDL